MFCLRYRLNGATIKKKTLDLLVVSRRTASFNTNSSSFLPCAYIFKVFLQIDTYYFTVQVYVIGISNVETKGHVLSEVQTEYLG